MDDLRKHLKIIAVHDQPAHAPMHPGKKVVVIYNDKNGTKNIFIMTQELEMIACPIVWEGNKELVSFIQESLGTCPEREK